MISVEIDQSGRISKVKGKTTPAEWAEHIELLRKALYEHYGK